jgi:hypothetical protein
MGEDDLTHVLKRIVPESHFYGLAELESSYTMVNAIP